MSSGPGRGALIGGLVAVLAIAVGVWLMTSEGGREAAAPAKPTGSNAAPEEQSFTGSGKPSEASPIEVKPSPGHPLTTAPSAAEDELPLVAQGQVSWAAGALPPDVDVSLYDSEGEPLDTQSTDDKGHYELRWGDPLNAGWSVGTDSVRVKIANKPVDLAPDNVGPLPMHMPKEPPVKVDLVLGLPPVLVGSVHDRLTGEPLAHAIVSVGSAANVWAPDTITADTDEQGNYTLAIDELPLRGLMIWATAEEHLAQLVGPQDLQPAAQPGGELRFDFTLDKAAPWHGRVIAAATGQPIEGATITVGNDFAALADIADFETTDENGEFTLDLPDMPATGAWLHVYTDEDGFGAAFLRNIQPGQDLLIRLGGRPTLQGKVLLGKDQPARLADVTIYFDGEPADGMNGLSDTDRTDGEGLFSIPLQFAPTDSAKVRIEAMGYATWEARLADVAKPNASGDMQIEVQLVEESP